MSLAQVKIDWDASPYINEVRAALNEVVKEGALKTSEDAKRILGRVTVTGRDIATGLRYRWSRDPSTGNLASQIDVSVSKFKDGGWVVEAQGKGNYTKYYASFVELGTSKMEARPYLRPALRRNRYRMRKLVERALGAIVR